ncbi:MAG TPA: NYN domain-containing protein [Firmicutes bacterium]|nr:NYN domain-containing protein [Bacillota bacterium]
MAVKTLVLIDYENIHWSMKRNFKVKPESARLVDLVSGLVQERFPNAVKNLRAYADFDLDELRGVQTALQRKMVDTRHVYGKTGPDQVRKNASDLELMLDAYEVALTDSTYNSFVLVGGDRDLIPLVRRLKSMGKTVVVIGVKVTTSQDLIETCTEQNFVSLESLWGLVPTETAAALFGLESLIRLVADLENALPFIGQKYLAEKVLPKHVSQIEAYQLIGEAIDKNILVKYKVRNPNNQDRPTSAVRLNHDHDTAKAVLAKRTLLDN